MIVFELKLKGNNQQYLILNEMIRTANFIRNKALRYWLDNQGTKSNDLQKLCAVLAKEYEWANKLNSQARQASADRAWFSISRFYANYQAKKQGKKGFPKFKKKGRSVEFKTTGWSLFSDKKYLTLTDKFGEGIDVGLEFFYTDSEGNTVENPRYLRKSQKALKRLQRKSSKKKKGVGAEHCSAPTNRRKANQKLARKHLKVSEEYK